MKAVLINPNRVVQRDDPFTTGIVYMPVYLASVVASLRASGVETVVIDAFGERPRQVRRHGQFSLYGLLPQEVAERVPEDSMAVFVYAINLTNHLATVEIVREVKRVHPRVPVVILENTQAVTAYALKHVAQEFYEAGSDFILTGEAEERAIHLSRCLAEGAEADQLRKIDGLGAPEFYNTPVGHIRDLDALPFPAWDLFPLRNYWSIRHAHGPTETGRYLPLLTSRGCPYPCRFCVVPEMNDASWRARSARNTVDEIEVYSRKFEVTEFHLEDLNPTISETRTRDICRELLRRDLKVTWKIVAGTKVESIKSEETIDLMARAGCRYISISPETGSRRLLKLMRKPFDLRHAVRIVKRMNEAGIRSQACFVLGFPGETSEDLQMTWDLVRELTWVGVDEIGLFIVAPVPGAAIYKEFAGYHNLSQLTFSPTWRADYPALSRFRLRLYIHFLLWKLRAHPLKMLRQVLNFFQRRFETKMEMAPYRALVASWSGLRAR
jgi:radical SAM superfamily enzyme YgiQ (UPF0313 family)